MWDPIILGIQNQECLNQLPTYILTQIPHGRVVSCQVASAWLGLHAACKIVKSKEGVLHEKSGQPFKRLVQQKLSVPSWSWGLCRAGVGVLIMVAVGISENQGSASFARESKYPCTYVVPEASAAKAL